MIQYALTGAFKAFAPNTSMPIAAAFLPLVMPVTSVTRNGSDTEGHWKRKVPPSLFLTFYYFLRLQNTARPILLIHEFRFHCFGRFEVGIHPSVDQFT